MATAIQTIYRGSVTYIASDGIAPPAILLGGTVDPAKSIVSITTRNSDAQSRAFRHFFKYDLTATSISFSRNGSLYALPVTIEWEVIEFSTGVFVQRGNTAFSAGLTTLDIPISAVVTGQSVVLTNSLEVINSSAIEPYYGDLTSATNLRITTDNAATNGWVNSWQVVEFDVDVIVQNGLSSSAGGASITLRTVAITSADVSRAFILHRGMAPRPSQSIGRETQTIGFNSSTQIQIESLDWGTNINNTTAWSVVELPAGSIVYSGSVAVLNGANTPVSQPSWTTALNNGSTLNAYAFHQNRKTQQADNAIGHYQFAVSLDIGAKGLTIQRDLTSNDHVVNWFAIDWPPAVAGDIDTIVTATTQNLSLSTNQTATFVNTEISSSTQSLLLSVLPAIVDTYTDIVAASQSLSLLSLNTSIDESTEVEATTQNLSLTPFNTSIDTNVDTDIVAASQSLSLSSLNTSIDESTEVEATTRAMTVTPILADISINTDVFSVTQSLALASYPAVISADVNINVTTASLNITELQAEITVNTEIYVSSQSLTIATVPAEIDVDVDISVATQTLDLVTYQTETDTITEIEIVTQLLTLANITTSIDENVEVEVTPQALIITPLAAIIEIGQDITIPASTQALVLAELPQTVEIDHDLTVTTQSLSITPSPVAVNYDVDIIANSQSIIITPITVTVSTDTIVTSTTQPIIINEIQTTVSVNHEIEASLQELIISPLTAFVSLGNDIITTTQALTLSSLNTSIDENVEVEVTTQALLITPISANITSPVDINISATTQQLQLATIAASISTGVIGFYGPPVWSRRVDVDGNITYIGESQPGSGHGASLWRIYRVDVDDPGGDIETFWAEGSAEFDKIWNDRFTYNYS